MPRRRIAGEETRLQLFLTSALDGQVSGQLSAPVNLPRKRASLNRIMGGPQRWTGDSGEKKKTLASPRDSNSESSTPCTNYYINYIIPVSIFDL